MAASSEVMRLSVIAVLSLATAAMFVVSLRGNFLFGYGIGQTPEKRQLFAWANVAADVWKAFGLIVLTVLWRNSRRMAVIGGVAWFACLLSGVNSAIGVYVHDRMTMTGARHAKHTTYADAAKELAELEGRVQALPSHRSTGQVEAAIAAVLATPVVIDERVRGTVGQRSANCTKIDARTADACAKASILAEELAASRERDSLEPGITDLRRDIAHLREEGAFDVPDPIGEFYAWATRGLLSARDVSFGFPLFFAFLIEVVSAFGPITIARYAEVTRRSPSDPDVARPAPARHGELQPTAARLVLTSREGRVDEWMAARAVPAGDTTAIGVEVLHADYALWCSENRLHPLTLDDFARAFDALRKLPELAGKIRKFGGRYYGIGLTVEMPLASQRTSRAK